MNKKKKWILLSIVILLALAVLGIGTIFGINAYVKECTSTAILSPEEAVKLDSVDCILVLGCKVKDNGVPSDMLNDRLRRGVELFNMGAAPKLLMTGDHGRESYDEVDAMKQYAVDKGISSSDVFMDHAGFSTYESMYRARDIFKVNKVIIVTQEYHLYRAVYIAQSLGLDAYGVSSDYRNYSGQTVREIREIFARVKDFVTSLFQPLPTYGGEAIPIYGDGNLTNDDPYDFI